MTSTRRLCFFFSLEDLHDVVVVDVVGRERDVGVRVFDAVVAVSPLVLLGDFFSFSSSAFSSSMSPWCSSSVMMSSTPCMKRSPHSLLLEKSLFFVGEELLLELDLRFDPKELLAVANVQERRLVPVLLVHHLDESAGSPRVPCRSAARGRPTTCAGEGTDG